MQSPPGAPAHLCRSLLACAHTYAELSELQISGFQSFCKKTGKCRSQMRESVVLKYGARSRCRVRRSHFLRLCNRRLDYLSIVASMDVVAHGASAERRKVVLRGTLHSGTVLRVLPFLLKRKGPPCGFIYGIRATTRVASGWLGLWCDGRLHAYMWRTDKLNTRTNVPGEKYGKSDFSNRWRYLISMAQRGR